MTWKQKSHAREQIDEYGYVLRWDYNAHGTYHNLYAPNEKHIASGYDRAKLEKIAATHWAAQQVLS